MEQSCLKIPFSILQCTKKEEKAIFLEHNTFFWNVACFARKFLSIRTLLLTHSKLVGTPCRCHEIHQNCTLPICLERIIFPSVSKTNLVPRRALEQRVMTCNFDVAQSELRASPRNPKVATSSKSSNFWSFDVWCFDAVEKKKIHILDIRPKIFSKF